MIVCDCSAYQNQKNIESNLFFSRTGGDSMLIQMTDTLF
ncbi:hypothetical protein BAZMOX_47261_0 [methanotrophic endosymbiont of Bathymodiolus azoricus (Menez Gwen)]|nr:hypothetical protein BAZMOX_47261_0 [methanotrophic endosymbiont of Bathymodiolus azoricus (Menez Gwen)]